MLKILNTNSPRGRGVFTTSKIAVHTLIEACPIILIRGVPYHELPQEIQNVIFNWAALIGSGVNLHAIALGYGSLYNHADQANCAYTGNIDDQALTITSLRNIQAGEELTINYDHPTGQGKINAQSWFAQRGLKPI